MTDAKGKKHVIILGAGASVTSGYPMANALRLLMSSKDKLRSTLFELGKFQNDYIDKIFEVMMGGEMKETIELFRHGGFATVDEFSSLAYNHHAKEVQNLKRFLRFALSLHDPEVEFEKSDYYYLIQKLFHKGLFPIRQDVAILTFNYDPYLPYLLRKAHTIRNRVANKMESANSEDAITSGFTSRLIGPLECTDDLCVLQLHGATAWPRKFESEDICTYEDLFGSSIQHRVKMLCFSKSANSQPPILFPWELFTSTGGICTEAEFCLKEKQDDRGWRQGGYAADVSLHQLFASIWKRAQKEITEAGKISFVGLSMHEFLNPAFKYLFEKRKENAAIICATKDHEKFRSSGDVEAHTNPRSPTFKVRRLLKAYCPEIIGVPNMGERQVWTDGGATVRVRETFRDFIENEL